MSEGFDWIVGLRERLEVGVEEVLSSEGWRRYLTAQAKFHAYSPLNVLLILLQRPDATQVEDRNTWRELGRSVRKAERGIVILLPDFGEDAQPEADQGHSDALRQRGRHPVRFHAAYVFDIAQTDGAPLPIHPAHELSGDTHAARLLVVRLLRLAALEGLELKEVAPETLPDGTRGLYEPARGRIVLPQGLSMDQRAKTLAHELAHHMLSHGRGRRTQPVWEIEAEGAAFVVCAHYGLDTSEYSFGYVAEWMRRGGSSGWALAEHVLSRIQVAAQDMIDNMEPKRMRRTTGRPRAAAQKEA
jgi:antirestriction protein ArdC